MEEAKRDDALFEALSKSKKRKKRRRILTVLIILAVLAALAVGGWSICAAG